MINFSTLLTTDADDSVEDIDVGAIDEEEVAAGAVVVGAVVFTIFGVKGVVLMFGVELIITGCVVGNGTF